MVEPPGKDFKNKMTTLYILTALLLGISLAANLGKTAKALKERQDR